MPSMRLFGKSGLVVTALAAASLCAAEPTTFTISSDVLVSNVPAIGVNVHVPNYRPWGEAPLANVWSPLPNPEPMDYRGKGVATGGGEDFLEDVFERGQNKGLSHYGLLRGSFLSGATVAVYRYQDGKCALLRTATVKDAVLNAERNPDRVIFTTKGPSVQAGDEYVVCQTVPALTPANYRPCDQNAPLRWWLTEDKRNATNGTVSLDATTAAPEGGSRGSLKAVFAEGSTGLSVQWLGSQERFVRLNKGATYVFRAWMKQQGLGGPVAVDLGGFAHREFSVGADWKLHSFEFPAGELAKGMGPIRVSATGTGTLWLDNTLVFEKCATPPLELYPATIERVKAMRPGFVRIWTLQPNRGSGWSLDACLAPKYGSNLTVEERGADEACSVNLHQMLELCRQAGAKPWIITSTMFTLEEQQGLIEYLAGPADSPYGKKRAALGRAEPWTAASDSILIELGNEVWNGMFSPQNFPGRAEQYGMYAELVFQTMKKSPHFKPGQMQFVLNGWAANAALERGYGQQAAAHCPSADFVDFAPYLGGWDVGGSVADDGGDASVLNLLMLHRRMFAATMQEAKDSAAKLSATRGRPLRNALYESGPGYSLPGPGKPIDEDEQTKGKSLASALAYFDQLLSNAALGFGPQQFFTFKTGNYWATHNDQYEPHATTLGIQLLNTHATGNMLKVTGADVPTITLPAATLVKEVEDRRTRKTTTKQRKMPAMPDVPVVHCYAFRDGRRLTIALLSLRSEGTTPVQLNLPAAPAPAATIYTLTGGSPLANNIHEMQVIVKETKRTDLVQSCRVDLPPLALVLLVGETR